MFFLRPKQKPDGEICDWLLDQKEAIRDGTASFEGAAVSESTELRQYQYTVSPLFMSVHVTTQHMLPRAGNDHLRFTGIKYSLISLIAGPWCFPWGPIFTVSSLVTNLRGGKRQTVSSVLATLEWGYQVSDDIDPAAHRRQLVTLDSSAVAEINARRTAGGFEPELAVRVVPTKWSDAECEIQFDYPISDGRDWVDESNGLVVLIDKKHAEQCSDTVLHFGEGRFVLQR